MAKNAGDVDITVKLKRGDRDVCSYNYKLTVLEKANDPNTGTSTAEICIVFANGSMTTCIVHTLRIIFHRQKI